MTVMSRHILYVAAAIVLCAGSASATVTVPAEFRAIVTEAALIVRGHVTDVRGVLVPDRGIESIVTVAVDTLVKGPATDVVSLALPGGVVGRYRSEMVGAPKLQVGAQGVFFLKRDASNTWRPVGLSMGIFTVQSSASTGLAVVNPPLVSGLTADVGRVVRGDARRQPMGVGDFESLVRLVMAGQAAAQAGGGQ
jgi:hypothetical protein